ETMHLQRMANRHQRGVDRAAIGTVIDDPAIDFAKLAQSMGVAAEGPIENPRDLGPALARAAATVRRGEPALVDVVTQPRSERPATRGRADFESLDAARPLKVMRERHGASASA